jgi:hypothetical protein
MDPTPRSDRRFSQSGKLSQELTTRETRTVAAMRLGHDGLETAARPPRDTFDRSASRSARNPRLPAALQLRGWDSNPQPTDQQSGLSCPDAFQDGRPCSVSACRERCSIPTRPESNGGSRRQVPSRVASARRPLQTPQQVHQRLILIYGLEDFLGDVDANLERKHRDPACGCGPTHGELVPRTAPETLSQ